jgi:multidrug efflux pump subunit AcrA (membrane-fusion protein)
MRRTFVILAIVIVIGGAAAVGWWYINENPEWWFWLQDEFDKAVVELGLRGEEVPIGLAASGFVEADEASVTTELGGRIVTLYADEGDGVTEGQILVELDDSLLLSQIVVAEAEVAVAEAALARVEAGVRQETIDRAQAMLDQARTAQEAARIAWEDAQAMLENPQEIGLALTAARAQLGVLRYQQQQAQALANSAQAGRDFADEAVQLLEDFGPNAQWFRVGSFSLSDLPPEIPLPPGVGEGEYRVGRFKIIVKGGKVTVFARAKIPPDMMDSARYQQAASTYQSWMAWTGLAQAEVARAGAENYLEELARQEANPLVLQAQTNSAKAQYEIATAAVGLAQAQVDGLQMGATPEQIAAAESQVEIARAALEALETQKYKFTLEAPISGLVLERPMQMGEVALPGAPLMTLADLDKVTLTIYVPEDQLGQVQLGQPVSVTVDAYPDRTFQGRVVFISSQAEFTPKNVQTREERVNMVFAVKVRLPNPDHALKPGMPADAVLSRDDT